MVKSVVGREGTLSLICRQQCHSNADRFQEKGAKVARCRDTPGTCIINRWRFDSEYKACTSCFPCFSTQRGLLYRLCSFVPTSTGNVLGNHSMRDTSRIYVVTNVHVTACPCCTQRHFLANATLTSTPIQSACFQLGRFTSRHPIYANATEVFATKDRIIIQP